MAHATRGLFTTHVDGEKPFCYWQKMYSKKRLRLPHAQLVCGLKRSSACAADHGAAVTAGQRVRNFARAFRTIKQFGLLRIRCHKGMIALFRARNMLAAIIAESSLAPLASTLPE